MISCRRLPEWLVVVGVGLGAAVVFTVPFLINHNFYFIGDNAQSFVPNWHHFGNMLLSGQWPTMESSGWYGGNYVGEAAASTWNPVFAAQFIVVSFFNDLGAAAAVVVIGYLVLLATATYLLAREYSADRVPAIVVGVALPASGFTLFYEASGWPAGLAAFVWTSWFWWSARRYSRGAMSPIWPFLIGAMAVTIGNPYAALGVMIVLTGIGIELLLQKDIKRLAHLLVTGVCVGTICLPVFLPLLGTLPVTARQELATIANDTFLVPHIGDLATSSVATFLPAITNWGGNVRETLPSMYFMWFAVPLLPWLRWQTVRYGARTMSSIVVIGGIYAVLSFAPSNMWLFRWPLRMIEYLYLAAAVVFAVVLSKGLAGTHIRRRVIASISLIVVGSYLAFAVRPEYWQMHVAVGFLLVLLTLGTIAAYHNTGWRTAGTVLLVGTLGVVGYQTSSFPFPGPIHLNQPRTLVSDIQRQSALYRGTFLQLAQEKHGGEGLLFGNLSVLTGHESVTRYSGVGFESFMQALCMNYKGSVCPDAYQLAWRPLPGTDVPLIDAMRVQTLVLQNRLYPKISRDAPPAGWSVAEQDEARTVWVRNVPLPYPGRISWASPGVEVASSATSADSEQTVLQAPPEGGRVIFARLNWPGYIATIGGKQVRIHDAGAGLLSVDVPPGPHKLTLDFQIPGLRLGAWIAAAGAGLVILQTIWLWYAWRKARRRRVEDGLAPAEPAVQDRTLEEEATTDR